MGFRTCALSATRTLLEIAVIEARRLRLDLHLQDVADLLRKDLALMRVIAEAEGVGLEVFIDDDVPALMADAVKVESVAGGGNTFHVRLPRRAFRLRTVKATSRT